LEDGKKKGGKGGKGGSGAADFCSQDSFYHLAAFPTAQQIFTALALVDFSQRVVALHFTLH